MSDLKKEKDIKKSEDVDPQDANRIKKTIEGLVEEGKRNNNKVKIKLFVTEIDEDFLNEIIAKLLLEDDFDLDYILDRMVKDSSVTLQLRDYIRRNDIDARKKRVAETLLREIEKIRSEES
jgi:predicted outer membrane protein